jgi:hypothetical protein
LALRRLVLPLVPKDRNPPSLESAEGMIMIIRALNDLQRMRFWKAIRSIARIHDVRAYKLAIDWLLRRFYPRRFSSVVRTVICRSERDMESMSVALTRLARRSFVSSL